MMRMLKHRSELQCWIWVFLCFVLWAKMSKMRGEGWIRWGCESSGLIRSVEIYFYYSSYQNLNYLKMLAFGFDKWAILIFFNKFGFDGWIILILWNESKFDERIILILWNESGFWWMNEYVFDAVDLVLNKEWIWIPRLILQGY